MSDGDDLTLGAPLGVSVLQEGSVITIALTGELDLTTAHELEHAAAGVQPGGRCVLDLRELSFMDSAGIRALMRLDLRARDEGWRFTVVRGRSAVRRILDLCRVGDRIEVVDEAASIA